MESGKVSNGIAGVGYPFNSPRATFLHLGARDRLAVAPRHRQRVERRELRVRSLVSGHRTLTLVLDFCHYGVVFDLREFLLFLVGVYEFVTGRFPRIEPGHEGLRLHRFALREGDCSFGGNRLRLGVRVMTVASMVERSEL